ncbi:UPF0755 protein [Pedococcus dokdonensis]|uniref:Endolytic murein transglycosylase n=1 Tax=Pedococcus dokdonensis TaxID=443156 RepID=A0A1H0PKY0_9MICO|nr:endolytic transglycosylase MltG [Pedococcus dokdonensis]SDP05741.1 UPF0755 protein [Pedococcus dokdonensis]
MTDPHLEHSIFGGHEDAREGQPQARTRAERRRTTRPAKRRGRRSGCLFVALAVVALAAFAAYTVLRPVVDGFLESDDYPGPGTGEVQIVVNDGDTGSAIGRTLEKAGVVKSSSAYLDAAAADSRAAGIQPGTYTMKKQMTGAGALAILLDPKNRSVPRVTVREGLWKSEVFAALSKGTGVPVAEYTKAAKDAEAIGLPAGAKGNVEGYLFPSTYEFPVKATATQQLKIMVAKALDELEKAGVDEADYQKTLIVASIVEGEAGVADRGKVARVVENRLDDPNGPTVGLLQMDSTVNFALQKRGNLTKTEYDSAKSNPYDTYAHKGLPPGPISSPGAAAIEAAANPTEGPWFYFVTVNYDTGETLFAATQAEHDRNNAQRQAWCDANKPKCEGGG